MITIHVRFFASLRETFGQSEMTLAQKQHRQHAQSHHRPQDFDMPNPEKRPLIQQQIAQGAATKRGQEPHHAHAHGVEPFARGLEHAGQRERSGGAEFDQQTQGFTPGLDTLHGRIVAC